MREYLLILVFGAAVTYVSLAPVRIFARRFGFMTPVRDRDVHTTEIPRLGGVGMLVGLLAALLLARGLTLLGTAFDTGYEQEMWRGVVSGAVVITLVGAIDDRWDLDALTKFLGQALAGVVMALQGVQLYYLPVPGRLIVLDQLSGTLITVLVVVVLVNAMNFVDGLDGLAAGIGAISASAFFVFAYVLSVINHFDRALPAAIVTAVLAGVCLGFLPHNFSPARIFMGDAGAMLIGLLFAAAVVMLTGQVDPTYVTGLGIVPLLFPLLLPLAVVAVPFTDMLLAVVRRTRARRSPFAPDRQHLHHRLLQMGHSQRRAVLLMYAGSAVIAFGGLLLALSDEWWVWPIVLACVLALTVAVFGPRLRRGFVPEDARR